MIFSRRQQQVLGVFSLLYGLWLLADLTGVAQQEVHSVRLEQIDPPEMRFYLDTPVNVNTADSKELQLLPAIGPVTAQKIIEYRECHGAFLSADALQHVHGIGPGTVQKIRPYLIFNAQ